MANIYPSLISGNLLNLQQDITTLEPWSAGFHLDVMDFHFVPNLTWGPDFINAIRAATQKQIWVDLLVDEPHKYLDRMELNSGDIVSVHYESKHARTIFKQIQDRGWKASIGVSPETSIDVIVPLLGQIDHVLLMSVPPGFSGQPFVQGSVEKLRALHTLREEPDADFEIGMDGGLNINTLPPLLDIGIDTVAVASGIFGAKDPVEMLKKLEAL